MITAVQHLPVKAIMEGPAACFRLLDIDDSRGMKHAEYIGLLYSSTDNRLAADAFSPKPMAHRLMRIATQIVYSIYSEDAM